MFSKNFNEMVLRVKSSSFVKSFDLVIPQFLRVSGSVAL